VRYRGFGWKFSPKLGFTSGNRKSDDRNESYDEPTWYGQLVFIPHSRVYLSLRYRRGERRYATSDRTDSNFDRVDERPQWSGFGSVRFNDRISGTLYFSSQKVTSTRAGRSFDDGLLILGMIVRL
jgi:hypothetical protein